MSSTQASVAAAPASLFKRRAVWLALGVVIVLVAAALAYVSLRNKVEIVAFDGAPVHVTILGGDVQSALSAAGIQVSATDEVTPAPKTSLRDGMQIVVQHTFPLTLTVGGKASTVRAVPEQVTTLLSQEGIKLGPLDEVNPALDHVLQSGDTVSVVRVAQKDITQTQTISFPTKRWADPALAQGKTRVEQPGVAGEGVQTFRVTYRDGQESSRQLIAATVLKAPQAEIIGVGTLPSYQVVQTPAGPLRYTKKLEVLTTAYYPGPLSTGNSDDGLTATGLVAKRGIVAVDPKVIPLGTKLYVPGYGVAIAGDVGGAIKGDHIDLLFDTYKEAIDYGRKILTIYILAGD